MKEQIRVILHSHIVVVNPKGIEFFLESMEKFILKEIEKEKSK